MRCRCRALASAAGAALIGVALGVPTAAAQGAPDTAVLAPSPSAAPVDVAVEVARATHPDAEHVVVARDDAFADALSSGSLQAGTPLLLVPSTGPLPAAVTEEVGRLGATRATILGGPAAVGEDVEAELATLGLATTRRAGPDRVATAVAVARADASDATTAILVRAFGEGDDPGSRPFADALAAGALAARTGWPILLTATDRLSDATSQHLAGSAIEDVVVVGGPAAVSEAVEDAVRDLGLLLRRRAGVDRFATAVALVGESDPGASSAADVPHVVVVDGLGAASWAGGLAAASRAASLQAPVLLATRDGLPPPTAEFLAGGGSVPDEGVVLSCVQLRRGCELARRARGLPPSELGLRTFTLAATGDLLIHTDVTSHARQPDGRLDFGVLLEDVAPAISAADVGLCHLEVPLTTDHGDLSGYPTFNAPAELADGIAATGWDVCSTASNHTLDQGFRGVVSTLDVLDGAGVVHTGSARTAEEATPPVVDVEDVRVAFLSWTYGTNGIPVPRDQPWSVDVIDDAAITAEARAARDAGAEVVVLSLHWGDEYSHEPNAYQARIAEAVTRDGLVDLVVGHHAHVIQPVVPVHGVPVAFGLGNFLSGQFQSPDRSDGVILSATFTEDDAGAWTVAIDWTPTRVDRQTYRVRLLDDPQTATDRASADRTDGHMTWDG